MEVLIHTFVAGATISEPGNLSLHVKATCTGVYMQGEGGGNSS